MAASVAFRCLNRGFLMITRPAVVSSRSYVQGEKSPKVQLPPPPKRPLTSYMAFSSKIYPQVMKQHPDYKCPEAARTIGAMWKSMPEQEKQAYAPNYKQEMEKYTSKRQAYISSLSPEQKEALKVNSQKKKEKRIKMQKRKVSKELEKPKRPPNGYILFSNKQIANRIGEFKLQTDLFRKIAEEWRALAPEDKEMYNEAALDLSEQYNKDLLAWEERMIDEGHPELVRGYRKPTKPKKKAASKRRGRKKTAKKGAKKATKAKSKAKSEE